MKETVTREVKAWYSPKFKITLLDSSWAVIGPLPPHPQLVNLVLRRGLKKDDSAQLQILHELGHVQTLPAIIIYGGLLYYFSVSLLWIVVSVFLLWEIMSETYVIFREGRNYVAIYRSKSR